MTYGIGGTCAPGVLMGVAAGGVAPPTAITLYADGTLHPRTQTRAAIDGTQDPNWGITQGVPDITTGTGTFGIAWNDTAATAGNVPPNAQYSTFQVSMTNIGGGTSMEIDAADYWTNWVPLGATSGYPDMFNYGCYADGGTGTGVTWAWSVTITGQSLSGGTVAFVVGTPLTVIDGSFGTNGWTGVGEYIGMQSGRSGGPAGGDTINISVTATATNAGGTATGTFIHDIVFI